MTEGKQSLGVVNRLFPLILSGEKTSTIRWRETRVSPGLLTFVNDDDLSQTVQVQVTRCTDMPLDQVAQFVGRADEWPDHIMLEGMREHYPEVELSSIVQVIEFCRLPED
jgi:hypothetical protein